MSTLDQARPHGYAKAAKHARRHVQSIDSKQDRGSTAFSDPHMAQYPGAIRRAVGATSVPGYYKPKDEKYFTHHPREQYNTVESPGPESNPDPAHAVQEEGFPGFERDLEEQDILRWEKRRQISLQEQYDRWIARRFDIANPHVARWLKKIEPEFWERRWAFLQDKMQVETFLTRMRLYGPQSKEDFEGLYALYKDGGYVNARKRPMENRGRPTRFKYSEGRLARGERFGNNGIIMPQSYAHAYDVV